MHALLRRGGRRALLAVLVVGLVAGPASWGRAEYATVGGGLEQWVWARTEGTTAPPMTAVAVRPDGWLLVATNENQRLANNWAVQGGELHALPPSGGTVSAATRLGPSAYGFTRLVMRSGRLYGLTSLPDAYDDVGQKATLVELDPSNGAVLRELGTWWFPDLAVDPRTNDLVLYEFRCSGRCDGSEVEVGEVTHDLVRFNPDTGARQVLVPDPTRADIGGSSTCGPGAGRATRRCEEIFRLTFSPDGQWLFMATARAGTNYIDVRDHTGAYRGRVTAPRPADAIVHGRPGTCLADTVILSAFDGSLWGVRNPTGAGATQGVLGAGAPAGVSAAAVTADGHVVTTRRVEAQLVACEGFEPPPPPPPPPTPPAEGPAPEVPDEAAAAPEATPAGTNPASAPPPGQPGAPPPAGPPPPSPVAAGPPAHAPSVMTSSVGALADSPEDQPMFSLSASRRPDVSPLLSALGLAGAALAAMTLLVLEQHPNRRRPSPAPAPIERSRR